MRVWFEAPERFRLDVVDHTDYPTTTTPTDLKLVVDGSTWYAAGPSPCPTATCPQRESVVRNRLPFSTAAAAPTDLVLPISTLADADRLTVLGRGTVLGRPAVRVEVPFERAEPLFPFLSIGGDWRPFFPNDRVRIWLDERNWFPLRWNVYPATGAERDAWALRFGLPDEPSLRSVFSVRALRVSLDTPDAGVFDIPATSVVTGSGRSRRRAERRASGDRVRAGGAGHGRRARPLPRGPAAGRRRRDARRVRGRARVPQPRRDAFVERRRAVRPGRRAGRGGPAHRGRCRVLRAGLAGPRPSHRDPRGRDRPVPRVQPAAFASCSRPRPRSRCRVSRCPPRGRTAGSARRPPNASRSRPPGRPSRSRSSSRASCPPGSGSRAWSWWTPGTVPG